MDTPWESCNIQFTNLAHHADGITISGIQRTYPSGEPDRAGLLPDSFILQAQHRNPADINPATVGIGAARFYTQTPLYDFLALRELGLLIHAPGQIEPGKSALDRAGFTVRGWAQTPYFVLVSGFSRPPQMHVNGKSVAVTAPNEFHPSGGQLILQLSGRAAVELDL